VSVLLLANLILPVGGFARPVAELELYGTFHAMGVIATLMPGDDPDLDASADLEYKLSGSGVYTQGFQLTRVSGTRFVGSLFWLQPGIAYNVRITFTDPDGALDGISLGSTASTRAELSVPTPSKTHYVDPTGAGAECTLAAPCSLVEGLNQAQAGEAVALRGGIYHQGEFDLPRSGAQSAPILIQGYPGEEAILDGADPATFNWLHQGEGVFKTTVNVTQPHLVVAAGQRLYPYQSLSDLQNLIWDIPGFYASGTEVYVHLSAGADPNHLAMQVSRFNHAFYVERDYIYFLDLTFRNYGQGDYAKAIYFNNASENLVRGCTFAINDLGIGIKRASHRNLIQDNLFYDTVFDWPWDAVKSGSELETGGVRFYDPITGRGNVIRGNEFHDYFDGFGVCPSSNAGVTNETDVYENLVYNAGDDGMETDGQCSNVRIWDNTFHDVLMGISLAPVYTGPVYAVRNLVYRTGVGVNDYRGAPFKFNSGYSTSGAMYLFHNTADAALPGNNGLEFKSPGSWTMVFARNNIWSGSHYALRNANSSQPVDLNYDNLYTSLPDELAWWGGAHLNSMAALRIATGQELHGYNLPPGFDDPVAGDYRLSPDSNLIDKGVLIPGVNKDYSGLAPDLGAFEQTEVQDSIYFYLPLIFGS